MTISERYTSLISRFVTWAQAQPDIRAAVVIGSRARPHDHPADEWSDMDIVIFATDPHQYVSRADWVEAIGQPWLTFIERTAGGEGRERRVLFAGGLDVDFALFPVELLRHMIETAVPAEFAAVFRRGMAVLLDQDRLLERLSMPPDEPQRATPPTHAEFLELVNDFWYHAVWTAKKLRRGELWTAKGCSDDYMKWRLLRMIEWHARATNGWGYDTWHGGRFLEQWADPRVLEELQGAFAAYDEEDLWRGLFATMRLFRWLTSETAARLGFADALALDEPITPYVQRLFADREG